MRRHLRIASSAAATGAVIAGATAAIAATQHPPVKTPVPAQTRAATTALTDDVTTLRLRAEADATGRQIQALRRATARAHAKLAAEAKLAKQLAAARALAARQAAAQQAAAQSAQSQAAQRAAPAPGSNFPAAAPSSPPRVRSTTGASGAASGHGELDDNGGSDD